MRTEPSQGARFLVAKEIMYLTSGNTLKCIFTMERSESVVLKYLYNKKFEVIEKYIFIMESSGSDQNVSLK